MRSVGGRVPPHTKHGGALNFDSLKDSSKESKHPKNKKQQVAGLLCARGFYHQLKLAIASCSAQSTQRGGAAARSRAAARLLAAAGEDLLDLQVHIPAHTFAPDADRFQIL